MLKQRLLILLALSLWIGACGKNNGSNSAAYVLSHSQPERESNPTDLFEAVTQRNYLAVRHFATVESINLSQNNETPLELSLATQAADISIFLSAMPGLDIFKLNAKGQSYLFQASRDGQLEVIENLLRSFSRTDSSALTLRSLDQPTPNNQIALHVAATGAVAKALLVPERAEDDDIRFEDEMGFTPIHSATSDNRVDTIHWMVGHYCNSQTGRKNRRHPFNHTDKRGRTPLMIAGLEGSSAMLDELLLCKNIQLDATDADGNTALHWAAFNTDSHVYEKMALIHKLSTSQANSQGITPRDILYCVLNERMSTPIDPHKKDTCRAVHSMN